MAAGGSRGDIVISMTLAETFLLFVFMIWFAVQPSKPEGPDPQLELTALRNENQQLREQINQLRTQLDDVNNRLALWQKRFGIPLPASDKEWDKFTEKFKKDLGRGKPRCNDDNLLAQVSLENGATQVVILTSPPFQANGLDLKPGTKLMTERQIDGFLSAVQAYRNGECRFDYRLIWATDHDYVDAREHRFDRYLYPVERRQVKP